MGSSSASCSSGSSSCMHPLAPTVVVTSVASVMSARSDERDTTRDTPSIRERSRVLTARVLAERRRRRRSDVRSMTARRPHKASSESASDTLFDVEVCAQPGSTLGGSGRLCAPSVGSLGPFGPMGSVGFGSTTSAGAGRASSMNTSGPEPLKRNGRAGSGGPLTRSEISEGESASMSAGSKPHACNESSVVTWRRESSSSST